MLKLPVCPHCKTVYYYGEVINSTKHKQIECYHCKKNFNVSKWKGRILFYLIFAVVIGIINIALLYLTDMKTAMPIIVFTVICVLISMMLLPYTVRFKK